MVDGEKNIVAFVRLDHDIGFVDQVPVFHSLCNAVDGRVSATLERL